MKENRPDLTLDMDNKIYLAVSKDFSSTFAFVYTLACLKQDKRGSNTYDMFATREIHAFKNKETAKIYHATIEKIIEKNAEDETKQLWFSSNETIIERFLENCR